MAEATAATLRANPILKDFEFEIVVARPFVILMTRPAGNTPDAHDERKRRIDALARGFWRNWLKTREAW